jgi:nucleoside-diphosphate-sugar epimerase
MSVIRDALEGRDPECTPGEQIWDYLYSRDAARALLLLAEKGISGRTYPLGSGRAAVLKDYIDRICDICAGSGVKPQYGAKPYGEKQVMHLEADISSLTEDTGFVPEMSFEEGIKKTVRWMQLTEDKERSHV